MATLIDNPSPQFILNNIYKIAATDAVEGARTGGSFGGLGIDNEPHQQLTDRTYWLFLQLQNLIGGLSGGHAYTVPGTYTFTMPSNRAAVLFLLWGGGGAGAFGGAGAGAGFVLGVASVSPGGTVPVTIASGGIAPAPSASGPGGNGGASSFGSFATATGGYGAPGQGTQGATTPGSGSGGLWVVPGSPGNDSHFDDQSTTVSFQAIGGAAFATPAPVDCTDLTGTVNPPQSPGGGGGAYGGNSTQTSSAGWIYATGAPGACILIY